MKVSNRGLVGVALLVMVALAVVVGPLVYSTDPNDQNLRAKLMSPEWDYPLGTDQFGRDLLSRILTGGRTSLATAASIVAIACSIGTAVGLLAALPNRIAGLLTRLVDSLLALPSLVLALGVVGALGVGVRNLIIAFVFVGWPFYARLVRGFAVARLADTDIEASTIFGVRAPRVLATHVLPHVARSLGIAVALDLGFTLASLAGFSYLGLGAEAPAAEWGLLLRDSQTYFTAAPWLLLGPSVGIALTVLATSLISEHAHARGLTRG